MEENTFIFEVELLKVVERGSNLVLKTMIRKLTNHTYKDFCGFVNYIETERKDLEYHKGIIKNKLPLTVGGGFGQSRLCMLLLEKAHIGEVQPSVWSKEIEKQFEKNGVYLL